ncbi:MAG TPA: sensor histidine kinase [Steroidobacter sp.]|uniref:sensor histidine kinase n=1 Tax=Steroidobacter sp. TaxID=1978227 RepID=UPI002ED949A8
MPRSLRVRLLLSAAIAIFLALAAAWVVMTLLFERHVERRIEADLIREGLQLAAAVSVGPDGAPALEREPGDARFFEPASGLYWQVSTDKAALSSRSLWDQHLPPPVNATSSQWRKRVIDGPFNQQVLLVERYVRPERSGADVLIQLAHEQKSLHDAREEFGHELALFLAILWFILSAAAWIHVELGLRPLRHVRNEVETLKRNPRERMAAAHVAEIEPLTLAINELADAREKDLSRARRRAADLAHGLKTPLAALSAQSRRAREAGAVEAADGLDRAIAAARLAIESELARSRAAALRAAPSGDSTTALPLIESLIGVVERTEFGARLVFEVNIPEDLRLPVASEDLLEIAGALIENAARYARRRVRITGEAVEGGVLLVEDDGPGIGPDKVAEALLRGGRLDEAGSGHGLGLAIAHDLVDATRGTITLLRSELGGLKVAVAWPAATPVSRLS